MHASPQKPTFSKHSNYLIWSLRPFQVKKKKNNSYHWTYPFCTIQKQQVFGNNILRILGDKNFTPSDLVEVKKSHEIFSTF